MVIRILHFVILCLSSVNAFAPSGAVSTVVDIPNIEHSSTSLHLFRRFFGSVKPREEISEGKVRSLFYKWNEALATGDAKAVAKRYSRSPVLLPTISDVPRTDIKSITTYYENFLQLKPQGTIIFGKIVIGHNWAIDAGVYIFTMGATGAKVKARYTFVHVFERGEWKIAHHHSSTMPEGPKLEAATLCDDEIRALFYKWNDALATLDAATVTKRYATSAVLLPTVSDIPRTDLVSIQEYFENFLALKPQGVILNSFVSRVDNYCSDVGIYEFTMGSTGAKVKARYSFVYMYEDGEWKIQHHHSSVMPEGVTATKRISESEVTKLFHRWNDALKSLKPDLVADRYSKDAILLPTVSDLPCTNSAAIRDYFEIFLNRKPQGKILKSYISVGDDWCMDFGTYEFTMGIDNSKVQCRYSFIYTLEDGDWKILHHHSSLMPEALLGIAPTPPTGNVAVS